jgi:hypothetical protein
MLVFIASLEGKISSLQSLVLKHCCESWMYDDDAEKYLENFINGLHGLKELQLINHTRQIAISAISSHGKTLERLAILHPKSQGFSAIPTPAEPYTGAQLDELNESCPHLISLGLDMAVTSDLV